MTDLLPSEYECGACHEVFRGLEQFDRHQARNYGAKPPIKCALPATLGLVQNARGTWCTPEGLKAAENSRSRLAAVRSARRS